MLIKYHNPTSDFFLKGYLQGDLVEKERLGLFDQIEFTDVDQTLDDQTLTLYPQKYHNDLQLFAEHIVEKIVKPFFPKTQILEFALWKGVDHGSLNWHNDCKDITSLNSNILVYLDDLATTDDGRLYIRGQNFESSLQPAQGTIVWLNQSHIFEHKAERSLGQRRVFGIDLYIPDLAAYCSF